MSRLRRFCFFLFLVSWSWFLTCFISHSLYTELPANDGSYVFYFKENGKDLKYLICKVLSKAKHSIFVSSFGITDKEVAGILEHKSYDLPVEVVYDAKETNLLPKGPKAHLFPYTKTGLMHRKVIGIDKELLFLGSTNLTPLALKIHQNLIVCLRSKALYHAIRSSQLFCNESFTYYPLPETNKMALSHLIEKILSAQKEILIGMYVLTHPKILEALITVSNKGIPISIYLDRGMTNGACKKAVSLLSSHNIFVAHHLGGGLLHHKCALIDDSFLFGSSNWTKAAFTKNEEYLLFLHILPSDKKQIIKNFFHYLHKSSLPISYRSYI